LTDPINTDGSVPDPLSPEFAVKPEDVQPQRVGPWQRVGDWKWREFGREVQLRNARLPHLTLDVLRGELEALAFAVGFILSKPMPLPYRIPWHERVRQWWMRVVWKRKHHEEMRAAREALIEETVGRLQKGSWT
jgi:hypothetical protein